MSIRQKLSVGFGALVALTLVVVTLNYWSSEQAAQRIAQTTELHLPTVIASTRAQADLLRMLTGTRGYLALGEQKFRDDYARAKQAFEADIMLLDSLSSDWANFQHREDLQQLKTTFAQWVLLPEQLFELRDDQLQREPALRILMQEAQPILLKMTLRIRNLLREQGQRTPSRENLLLLEDMAHFQASFYAMIAGLRTYVTTGRESFKFEYTSNLTNNHEFLRALQQKRGLLTSAQQGLLNDILTQRKAFLQLPEKMFRSLEGEQARKDLYLFKIQAIPLAEAMQQSLERMTTDQQTLFRSDLSSEVQELTLARRNSLIGGGLALLLGIGLALLLRHNLVDRIDRVTEAARQIQSGDLSITVPVNSSDEIGTLGQTFNQMSSQLRETMQDLTRARDSAEAANQAKSIFLANMSHELRSPLNAILGFTQVMARSRTLSADEQENIDIIRRSGEHLLSLINHVLDLSKIEAGHMALSPKSFDLHSLLHDVRDMFTLKAETKGLQLLFERDERVPQYVRTDEVKLRQVLINLLNNAIKFTEEGGVAVRVASKQNAVCSQQNNHIGEAPETANCQLPTASLSFEVEDSGPGITSEEMEKVFEAFGQTETGRQSKEGTGLGLPISRKFVQLMGGDLKVKSEIGRGSIFTFDIHYEKLDVIEDRQAPTIRRVIGQAPGQPRYKILIVDDRWANRQVVVKLLKPLGFELREAANGQEALKIWQQWQPHLIWMDMRMPVMNGYEATRRIRDLCSQVPSPPSRIIALTASSLEEEHTAVLDAGCDDYLRKPFRETELFELMSKHIGVRFVYEEEAQPPIASRQSSIENVLTPEALAALPAEWLARLTQGAGEADLEILFGVIERIRELDASLADALKELTNNFRYDEILAFIDPIRKKCEKEAHTA